MKSGSRIVALSGAVFLLAGCAGIPTAVSVASIYVNSLLVMRTNKGMADHAVSAAMEQDCGFVNILEHGAYCTDAPAPQLLAAMSADADMLSPVRRAPTAEPAPVQIPPVQVAAAAPVSAPIVSAALTSAVKPAATTGGERFLVVLASYRNPATAAAHAARLKRRDSVVTAVDVNGAAFHRVALRAASQPAALRMLSQAKASGAPGAWVLATASGAKPAAPDAAPKPQRPAPFAPAYATAPAAPLL